MKSRTVLIAATLGSCTAPPTPQQESPQGPIRELASRSAGNPQRCVPVEQMESVRVADNDRHLLLYGSGKIIWVNDLGPNCGFNRNDVIVTEPFGSVHCRGDLIRSFDRYSKIAGPSCVLSQWVPYTR